MFTCTGDAATNAGTKLAFFPFERRDPGANDVAIEMIPIDRIETAYGRLLKSDVKHRFVIDMASLPKAA